MPFCDSSKVLLSLETLVTRVQVKQSTQGEYNPWEQTAKALMTLSGVWNRGDPLDWDKLYPNKEVLT